MAKQGKARVLTPSEIRTVLKLVELTRHSKRNIAMLHFSFKLAFRVCEIRRLKINHVLEKDGVTLVENIVLEKTMTKNKITNEIPLVNEKVREALTAYISSLKDIKSDSPLFPSQKGGHFKSTTIVMLFKRFYKMAKLNNAKSHTGRRTGITLYYKICKDITLTQKYARHQSGQMTMGYIEVDPLEFERTLQRDIY